jgi:3-oxoacyl-[acyl-carrier protein] reductase
MDTHSNNGSFFSSRTLPEISVNCIAPSLKDTPLSKPLMRGRDTLEQTHPLKRLGEPGDIAAIAAFLLTEEASWITGQVIGVDVSLSTRSFF